VTDRFGGPIGEPPDRISVEDFRIVLMTLPKENNDTIDG
jgi:hypothetical protein